MNTGKRISSILLWLLMLTMAACGNPRVAQTDTTAPARAPAPTRMPALSATHTPSPTLSSTTTSAPTRTISESVTYLPIAVTVSGTVSLQKIVEVPEALTYATHAGNASVMYLVAKAGRVLVLENGTLRALPFLDITDRVKSSGSEQGLLSIAFNPGAPGNTYVYVNYTNTSGNTVISRFNANMQANSADPNSEQKLKTITQPYPNHNGGQLQFGPDGMLYIGMGDGGSGGDPQNHAQNPADVLGKMLRINVSTINGTSVITPEIWALGLRNPWRFSFDRQTGDLYIADVGQNQYEEINFAPVNSASGLNYGWNLYEGFHAYLGGSTIGLTPPIYEYSHALGCSVTGGYVYRGQQMAWLNGAYLYSDYCSGTLWSLRRDASGVWHNALVLQSGLNISSFGEDAAGELYVIDLGGAMYRLELGD